MQAFISLILIVIFCVTISAIFSFYCTSGLSKIFKIKKNHTISLLIGIFLFFITFSAIPMPAPQITFSNGEKTIVFQGMIHIGKGDFYKKVNSDANNFRDLGYTIVHEGVGLVIDNDSDLSCTEEDFTSLNGYLTQPSCLGGIKSNDKVFELSSDDFRSHVLNYLASYHSNSDIPGFTDEEVRFISEIVFSADVKSYNALNPSFLTLRLINLVSFGSTISSHYIPYTPYNSDSDLDSSRVVIMRGLIEKIKNTEISKDDKQLDFLTLLALSLPMNVIVDHRNKILSDGLQKTNGDSYVMYGMSHIPGVYAELKKSDPRWKIEKTRFLNVIPLF